MKVNIDKTVNVTDEQRVNIARVLHGEPKRTKENWATRDELKEFIWTHGASWQDELTGRYAALTGEGVVADEPDEDLLGEGDAPAEDEDLLGDASDEDLLG